MVTVPVFRGNSVERAARPVGAVQPVRNPVGEAIGDGLRQLGGQAVDYARQQDALNEEFDKTQARQMLVDFQSQATPMMTTYLSSEGVDALNGSTGAREQLTKLRQDFSGKATNDRMRRFFDQAAVGIETGFNDKIQEHSLGALKTQQVSVAKAEQAQFLDAAVLSGMDEKGFRTNLNAGLLAIESEQKLHGASDVAIDIAKRNYTSTARKLQLNHLLADNLKDDAIGYAAVHRADFNATDLLEVSEALKEPLASRQGVSDFARVRGVDAVPNAAPGAGETLSPPAMFSHGIVPIEGGTGKRGEFLTSPKGAIGPAQVMPATAPEAAKLAGLPWDEHKYKTDAAYNLALGQAYFAQQLKTFGDPRKAAAAYNAGPGGLRKAMSDASKSGKSWREHLPAETKAYVSKFEQRIGASAGNLPYDRVDENDIYGRIEALSQEENWPLERKRAAEAEADRYITRQHGLVAARENDAKDAALDWIGQNGDTFTSTSSVPRQIWNNLSPEMKDSLEGRAASNGTSQAVKANSLKAMELSALIYGDPDQFLKTDLGKYVGQVTAGELSAAVDQQAKMRGPAGDKTIALRSSISTAIGTYTDRDPAMSKLLDKKDKPEAYAKVSRDMEGYLLSVTGGKRDATGAEMDAAWRRAVMPVTKPGGWFSSSKEVPRFEAGDRYQVAVPFAVRERIIREWRAVHNGQMPPDGVIGDIYVRGRGRKDMWP